MRFRLAMGLGKTLAELDQLIDREEWLGWQAYWQLEPWGCVPADQRTEYQLQLMFALNSKKNTPIPTFLDRNPKAEIKAGPSSDQLDDKIRDWMAGRTIIRAAPTAITLDPISNKKDRGSE